MLRALPLTIIAALLAAPVLAGTTATTPAAATCSKADASKFSPLGAFKAKLTAEGMKVKNIKTEGGCYEVYAIDSKGKKVNAAYNAETLEPVANVEAGEN